MGGIWCRHLKIWSLQTHSCDVFPPVFADRAVMMHCKVSLFPSAVWGTVACVKVAFFFHWPIMCTMPRLITLQACYIVTRHNKLILGLLWGELAKWPTRRSSTNLSGSKTIWNDAQLDMLCELRKHAYVNCLSQFAIKPKSIISSKYNYTLQGQNLSHSWDQSRGT